MEYPYLRKLAIAGGYPDSIIVSRNFGVISMLDLTHSNWVVENRIDEMIEVIQVIELWGAFAEVYRR
jgi:hypothetical protein